MHSRLRIRFSRDTGAMGVRLAAIMAALLCVTAIPSVRADAAGAAASVPAPMQKGGQPITDTIYANEDTFVDQNVPNDNKGFAGRLDISSLLSKNRRILINFDLSSIPDNSIVVSANLYIFY